MSFSATLKASPHLLVVEDNLEVREGLQDLLEESGMRVSTASDGDSAIGLLKANPGFDLILLDLGLPEKDGFEVLHVVQSISQPIPVLVVTGRGDRANKLKGFHLGADDYLVKPFDPAELLARIQALLRRTPKPPLHADTGASLIDKLHNQLQQHILSNGQLHEAKQTAEADRERIAVILKRVGLEIRTQLSSIMGYSDVLAEETSGHHQEFADVIKACSKQVEGVLDTILDLERLEGDDRMQFDIVDLRQMINHVLDTCRPLAHKKQIRLHLDVPENRQVAAHIDHSAMSNVMRHVIGNAIDHTDGDLVETRISLEEGQAIISIACEVRNNGSAMLMNMRTVDDSETNYVNLGMLISKQLVEQMGGHMDIRHLDGEGELRCTLVFPAADHEPRRLPAPRHHG